MSPLNSSLGPVEKDADIIIKELGCGSAIKKGKTEEYSTYLGRVIEFFNGPDKIITENTRARLNKLGELRKVLLQEKTMPVMEFKASKKPSSATTSTSSIASRALTPSSRYSTSEDSKTNLNRGSISSSEASADPDGINFELDDSEAL